MRVVGMQEGRSRAEQVRSGTCFSMYCAAADAKSNCGAQLWVDYDLMFRLDAWEAPRTRIVIVADTVAADEGRDRVPLLA
eukprot:3524498-Pyramimonas_sp.AAC.1